MPLGRTAIQRASTPLIKHAVAYGVSLKNSNRPTCPNKTSYIEFI